MAAFLVIEEVRIPADAQTRFIAPGAVYIPGDQIGGLTQAEAAELITIAPHAFEPLDDMAHTVVEWFENSVSEAE